MHGVVDGSYKSAEPGRCTYAYRTVQKINRRRRPHAVVLTPKIGRPAAVIEKNTVPA